MERFLIMALSRFGRFHFALRIKRQVN